VPTEPISDVAETSAWADEHTVTFRLADAGRALAGVRLVMVKTLRGQGYPATLHEVPDMHNYPAWRDAFHPHLTELHRQASR